MKRKYKDMLKSKWGWIGALIGVILIFTYGNEVEDILEPFTEHLGFISQFAGYLDILIMIILGFIAGLILQKIWRKFR